MANEPGADVDLERLLTPASIAVVGASAKKENQGYEFVQTLVEAGFPGPVYPVNPNLEELLGLKCYPDLQSIPADVDFVISSVPAGATLELVDGAIAKHAKLIHFFTARFSETGREDAAQLEAELKRRTKEAGIRVIGPNCMGVHYPKNKISFDPVLPRNIGNVGVLSQSGSHAFRIIGRGVERGVGFSKVISYGNAMDLNEADFLEHFAQDPDTEVIGAYIEGIRDGQRFLQALRAAASVKPVVVLKGGRTTAGRSAAASHTASLASQAAVWHAAVRQAGAMEVSSLNELIDMLVAFANAGPAAGPRVAILGGAGGEMVESADICNEAGLDVAPIPPEVRETLKEIVPKTWDWISNPIDGSILEWGRPQALQVLQTLAASPAYDVVLANVRWLEFMAAREDGETMLQETLAHLKSLAKDNGKATMFVLGDSESPDERRRRAVVLARNEFAEAGVALYPDIERAAKTLGRYVEYMGQRTDG
ncbi:MAG TPA: CoA-binding protein [Dehalococcoidia bacterium]|nr:CoA-binding protein [Dehalococcoidia bacterium]